MPKSQLDWLGVVSLWIGALIMALKGATLPLLSGAPTWLAADWWNYIPLVLITFYVAVAIYRVFHPLPSAPFSIDALPPAPDPNLEPERFDPLLREKIGHRRKLISTGRQLVAEFNQQVRQKTLMGFLQYRAEWPAIRAQLDPKVLADLENGHLVVATQGELKDGKIYYLMDELDRLEREWRLA